MVLCRKLLMRLFGVGTDADDFRASLLKDFVTIPESARFSGAAWRLILGIEIEHDVFFAKKTRQAH